MPSLHPKQLKRVLVTKWKVLRGDLVQITSGRDRGKQGIVKKTFRDQNRLIVEGCNLVKKHVKKTKDNPGYITNIEAPVHYSNVAIVDPQTGKPASIAYKFLEDGTKVRVSKDSGSVIPRPEILTRKRRAYPSNADKDTPGDEAVRKTLHEAELLDLRNRYLRGIELQHFNDLKNAHALKAKESDRRMLMDALVQRQAFERARQIVLQRREAAVAAAVQSMMMPSSSSADASAATADQALEQVTAGTRELKLE